MKIDVVIPCFNSERTVGRAIESALAQTFAPSEVIVVDDGSTDDSVSAILKYHGKVRLLRQVNKGPGAARNLGAAHANSEWLAMLDADDWWTRDKLRKQVDVLQHDRGNIGIVFSRTNLSKNLTTTELRFHDLWRSNPIPCSSVLIRKSALNAVGGFDEDRRLISNEDYNLWLRMSMLGWRIVGCDEALVVYAPGKLTNDLEAFLGASLFNIADIGLRAKISQAEIRRKYAVTYEEFGRSALWRRKLHLARQCFWRSILQGFSVSRILLLAVSHVPTPVLDVTSGLASKVGPVQFGSRTRGALATSEDNPVSRAGNADAK